MDANFIKRVQEEAARAAAIVQPHLAEIEKALGPQFHELRRAAESASAVIDPETAAQIRDIANSIDTETLRQMREAATLFSKNYELVAAELARAYASQELSRSDSSRRPTKIFEQRWKNDAARALSILSGLVDEDLDTPAASIGPHLEHQDAEIASYYYLRHLTQEQIGELMRLSQPAVAHRIRKVDAVVAHHLLLEKLKQCAEAENWELSFGRPLDVGGADLFVDLVARRPNSRGESLAIETKVVTKASRWLPPAERFTGWSEFLASQEPPIYRTQALYDLTGRMAYLCVDADLQLAHEKLQKDDGEQIRFGDLRPHLPEAFSLTTAMERAMPSAGEKGGQRDAQ